MKTEELLRNTKRIVGTEYVDYSREESADRRRLLRRILSGSKFSNCTDEQLDNMTAERLPGGMYVIRDIDNYDWIIGTSR